MRQIMLALVAAVGTAVGIVLVGGFLMTRTTYSEAEREHIRAAGSDRSKLEAEMAMFERPFDRMGRASNLSDYVVLPLAALAAGLVVARVMKRRAVALACASAVSLAGLTLFAHSFDARGAALAAGYVGLAGLTCLATGLSLRRPF
jgi:hypothetical protein